MGKDFCRTLAVYSEQDTSYFKTILQECLYNWDPQESEPIQEKRAPKIGRQIKTLSRVTDPLKGILSVTAKNK